MSRLYVFHRFRKSAPDPAQRSLFFAFFLCKKQLPPPHGTRQGAAGGGVLVGWLSGWLVDWLASKRIWFLLVQEVVSIQVISRAV